MQFAKAQSQIGYHSVNKSEVFKREQLAVRAVLSKDLAFRSSTKQNLKAAKSVSRQGQKGATTSQGVRTRSNFRASQKNALQVLSSENAVNKTVGQIVCKSSQRMRHGRLTGSKLTSQVLFSDSGVSLSYATITNN